MQKTKPIRDEKYRRLFQHLPCAYKNAHGVQCSGDVVAAHIRMGSGAGMGKKPDDNRCIPLCFAHHTLQHQNGELWFHGKNVRHFLELAARLHMIYLVTPPVHRVETLIRTITDFKKPQGD